MRSVMSAPLPGTPAYGSPYGHNEKSPLQNKPNPAAAAPPQSRLGTSAVPVSPVRAANERPVETR